MDTSINLALLRRLNFNHLVSFLAIAEFQSFRAAASQLHISQPALSAQIHRFEETLGVPLFHRTTRSVELSAEGKRLLPLARQLAHEMSIVASAFREEAALHQGVVSLATIPSIASSILPSVLKALAVAHPGLQVRLLARESSKDVGDMVRHGDADIGLLRFSDDDKDLKLTLLYDDEFVAVVPVAQPRFARAKHVTLRQLSEFPFFMQPRGSPMYEVLDSYVRQHGITLDVRQELLQAESVVAFVSEGLGVAILPAGSLARLNLEGCRVLAVRGVKSRAVGLAVSPRRSSSPGAVAVHRFIQEAAGRMRHKQSARGPALKQTN